MGTYNTLEEATASLTSIENTRDTLIYVRSQSISGNGNAMITEEVRKFPTRK